MWGYEGQGHAFGLPGAARSRGSPDVRVAAHLFQNAAAAAAENDPVKKENRDPRLRPEPANLLVLGDASRRQTLLRVEKEGDHRLHNRLQNGRPSEYEVQGGDSNATPKHEFITEFHSIHPRCDALVFTKDRCTATRRPALKNNLEVSLW